MKSTIKINGVTFHGDNVSIVNSKIIIDGKDVTPDSKTISIQVEGNIGNLKVDVCDKVSVTGNVTNLTTVSGDVSVTGDVGQNVQSVSGDVKCSNIAGKVSTISGDIKNKK